LQPDIISTGQGLSTKAAYEKLAANAAVLSDLKKAKKESDKGNYAAKTDILRKLLKAFPDEFKTDSENAHVVGLTHKPTNFRIHMPKKALPTKTKEEKQAGGGPLAGQATKQQRAEAQLKEWQAMPDGFRIGDNYNSKEKHLLRTLKNKGEPIPRLAFDHAIQSQKKNTWNGWESQRKEKEDSDYQADMDAFHKRYDRWRADMLYRESGPTRYQTAQLPGIKPGRAGGSEFVAQQPDQPPDTGSGPEFQGVTPPRHFYRPEEPNMPRQHKNPGTPPPEFNDKPLTTNKQAAVLAKLAKKVKAKDKKKKMHT